MGLFFKKNPNEANYVGGQKHITEVIKSDDIPLANGKLIVLHPDEDFNTGSVLIVNPGESAVFIDNGQIMNVFSNGRYVLTTENYPFISRLRNAFSGGVSTFHCKVYFVREASSIEIPWGTDSPIQVRDKLLGIETRLKARGAFKVKIADAGIFLNKLLGNNINRFGPEEIKDYFRQELLMKIKTCIAKVVNASNQEILGIQERAEDLSALIEPQFAAALEEYGVQLLKFVIASIDIADDELRRRYDEIGMDAIAKLRNTQADKAVQETLGDKWMAQQQVDIMKSMVTQQGSSATGANIGMGLAAGAAFFGMGQQMMQQAQPQMPPIPQNVQYYIVIEGQQVGPKSLAELSNFVQLGQLTKDTLVWKAGMASWEKAGELKELQNIFLTTPPPMPTPPPLPTKE